MQNKSTLVLPDIWRTILVALATIFIALLSGVSVLVDSSTNIPNYVLLLLAGGAATIALLAWLRKPVWAVYAAVFVVLLPANLIPAEINSFLNRSVTIFALFALLVDSLLNTRKIVLTASALFMLGFIFWAAVSLFWAPFMRYGMTILQVYAMRFILFMLLIANLIRTKKDLDGLLNTLALSGALLAVIGIATVLLQGYTPGSRLSVLDVNENELGIALLVTAPGVLWWAMKPNIGNKLIRQIVGFIFLVFSFILITMSGSRGSAISLVVILLIFLFWKPTRLWGISGLVILGLSAILAPFIFTTTISRFLGSSGETILAGRETIWPAGWQLILHYPFFGTGIGGSPFMVIQYLAQFGQHIINLSVGQPLHNPLMVIWAETGLPGLFLYLAILGSAVWSFVRQYFRSRRLERQSLLLYFSLVAATFIGYIFSWIKGGAMEADYSYLLMLALLLIPSGLRDLSSFD